MATRFGEFDILTGRITRDVARVRLEGDGYYLDISPMEDGGVEIQCSGSAGSHALLAMPRAANVLRVYSDTERDSRISDEARLRYEVWVKNEQDDVFKTRSGRPTPTRRPTP